MVWASNWQDGNESGIYGQRFSNAGIPQGNEFQVNTYTADDQDYHSLAALSTGDFVVVWMSDGQDGDLRGIYGQRFSNTGIPQGSEFQINTYTTSMQVFPSVAGLTSGGFAVVWSSSDQDGDAWGVYGRLYSSTGISQGSEFQINAYTINDQDYPSVAALSSGDFVVAWPSEGQDGNATGVYARIYFSDTGTSTSTPTVTTTSSVITTPTPSVSLLRKIRK